MDQNLMEMNKEEVNYNTNLLGYFIPIDFQQTYSLSSKNAQTERVFSLPYHTYTPIIVSDTTEK